MIALILAGLTAAAVINIDDKPAVLLEANSEVTLELTANPSTGVVWEVDSTGDDCITCLNGITGDFGHLVNGLYGFSDQQHFEIKLEGCEAGSSYTAKFRERAGTGRAGGVKTLKIVTIA